MVVQQATVVVQWGRVVVQQAGVVVQQAGVAVQQTRVVVQQARVVVQQETVAEQSLKTARQVVGHVGLDVLDTEDEVVHCERAVVGLGQTDGLSEASVSLVQTPGSRLA